MKFSSKHKSWCFFLSFCISISNHFHSRGYIDLSCIGKTARMLQFEFQTKQLQCGNQYYLLKTRISSNLWFLQYVRMLFNCSLLFGGICGCQVIVLQILFQVENYHKDQFHKFTTVAATESNFCWGQALSLILHLGNHLRNDTCLWLIIAIFTFCWKKNKTKHVYSC